jgi:hypothetical protein
MQNTLLLLMVLGSILALGGAIILVALHRTPEGFEDAEGFHFGRKVAHHSATETNHSAWDVNSRPRGTFVPFPNTRPARRSTSRKTASVHRAS